jgi:hypothetical protein
LPRSRQKERKTYLYQNTIVLSSYITYFAILTAASSSSSSPSSGAPTDWMLTYILTEPCDCEKITNTPSIEFISRSVEGRKGTKAERITGFNIKFFGESDEQKIRREADQQAKRLADIIAFKSKKRVLYNYDGISKKIATNPDRWLLTKDSVIRYNIRDLIQVLDLTDKSIAPRIVNSDDVTHRLHHASMALGAEELRLYAYMFTEFFQVVEEETNHVGKDYDKYSALRDVLSHRTLDLTRAMKRVNQHYRQPDDFEFRQSTTNPSDYEFNFDSEKNMRQLETEAKTLKGIAMSYLNTRI